MTYFGCEGSFKERSHAYKHDAEAYRQIVVRAGDEDWLTTVQLFDQCKNLSTLMRKMSANFKESSGGLLRAMVNNGDAGIVAVNEQLAEKVLVDRVPFDCVSTGVFAPPNGD